MINSKTTSLTIFTIGHSNRKLDEFINILKKYRINVLVDIRRFPTSKWKWFCKENLSKALENNGIKYVYLGEYLGGFRKEGFRNYMKTKKFENGLNSLLNCAKGNRTAIMCAEKIVFKCTRLHISRKLEELGVRVIHIVDADKSFELRSIKETKKRSTSDF